MAEGFPKTLRFGRADARPAAAQDPPTALETADVLLAAPLRQPACAVLIEPRPGGHEVLIETVEGAAAALLLPGELGNLVVTRIALVAGIDVSTAVDRVGQVALDVGGQAGEVLVMVNLGPQGLGLELRCLIRSESSAPPPPSAAAVPAKRLGHYRLIKKLGEGGTGTVFRAEHEALGKPVAIKILRSEVAHDPARATMLLREGRAASRAQHSDIVNVTDYGTMPDGRTYLVMELVEWPTLCHVMMQGQIAPVRAVQIARAILVALDAAHAHGVVHRDLKPENIFVGPEAQVKIGDFGTAQFLRTSTKQAHDSGKDKVWGTPHYMSPEQALGASTDRRTDIYAVGCILFEMLTGNAPYDAAEPVQVLIQHVESPVPTPATPEGPLPPILVHAVQRALAKSIDARYQTAGDMISDLDRCALALLRKGGWQQWLPI